MLLQPTFPSTAIEGSKNTILEPHVEGGGGKARGGAVDRPSYIGPLYIHTSHALAVQLAWVGVSSCTSPIGGGGGYWKGCSMSGFGYGIDHQKLCFIFLSDRSVQYSLHVYSMLFPDFSINEAVSAYRDVLL
jgi:hypothetical protein